VRREVIAEYTLTRGPIVAAPIVRQPAKLALKLLAQAYRPGELTNLLHPVELLVVE
jgi:hypothetical protein